MEYLHNHKGYKPEMLADAPLRELIEATRGTLAEPLRKLSVSQDIPPELTAALDENIFWFSGFKTHHELVEASRLLKDNNGGFKPFEQYLQDVRAIDNTYNRNYLNAEYNFATASTQMAVKWKEWEKDGDRYDLQYRTAGDDRVREEHAALDGTTLPPSDPFWNHYLPPNGWNCRCTTVQVRKGKYPRSNSKEAIARGQSCTAKPKQQIFRFNPGKQEKIFPPKHPYYKVNEEVKSALEVIAQRAEDNRREYERLKNNTNYKDVYYEESSGGMTAAHKDHNFDKKGGKYEKHVQTAGYETGHAVVFESERGFASKHTEGTWDGKIMEIAGRETATENNVLKGLKHCASKRTTQIAILDYPKGGFDKDILDNAIKRYRGLEKLNDGQFVRFEKIICVQGKKIVYEERF